MYVLFSQVCLKLNNNNNNRSQPKRELHRLYLFFPPGTHPADQSDCVPTHQYVGTDAGKGVNEKKTTTPTPLASNRINTTQPPMFSVSRYLRQAKKEKSNDNPKNNPKSRGNPPPPLSKIARCFWIHTKTPMGNISTHLPIPSWYLPSQSVPSILVSFFLSRQLKPRKKKSSCGVSR